jgi:hypothetical protein
MAIGRIPEPGTGIPESIIAAKGDVLTGTANDVPAVITVGANETRLVADSAAATGLKYVADTTNYAVAAKGDLLVGTAADTLAPLTVGTNGHTLVADSATATGLKWAAPAGGKILQVVTANNGADTSSATSTLVTTGLNVSITPSSTSSRILIMYSLNMRASSTCNFGADTAIYRGGTNIYTPSFRVPAAGGSTGELNTLISAQYIDSPSTTSATTYTIYFCRSVANSAGTVFSSPNSTNSSIVLMEIGA